MRNILLASAALISCGMAFPASTRSVDEVRAAAGQDASGTHAGAEVPGHGLLGPAERRSVVEAIATVMAARYADEDAGGRLAAQLRKGLSEGAYDRYVEAGEFAAALTAEMRNTVQDKHLRAMYQPNRPAGPAQGGEVRAGRGDGAPAAVATVDPRSAAQLARTNYGFDRVELLPGNIGYLKLSQFVPLARSEEPATAAMAFLANSEGVIIDLRGVPGGSPDLVARLVSYFTGPEPVTLMTTYMRAADLSEELRTTAEVPGRRMTDRPLMVLIDERTASSAEMFAYFVQRQGLGTLIGATTSGAGLGGNVVPAGSGIYVFVPQIRITDGPGWERTGIVPDVAAEPEEALEVAHAMLLDRLAEADSDPQARRERQWALELIRPMTGSDAALPPLSTFEGAYGARNFVVRDGALVEVAAGGTRIPLTRVGPDVFRSRTVRLTFEQDGRGDAAAVLRETIDGTSARIVRSEGPAPG